jgi:hypothetical protein
MARFSDAVLEEFPLEPKRELRWCKCPWCPGTILWGYRRDRPDARGIAGTTLVHTILVPETGQKSSTLSLDVAAECMKYAELAAKNSTEFLHLLAQAGAKMAKNE